MRRYLFTTAIGCLALMACTPAIDSASSSPPPTSVHLDKLPTALAPLAGTSVDEEVIRTAWKTADAGLYLVDFLRSFGWIKDGSPKAVALADGLETVQKWLNVADDARKAGNQSSATAAFAKASAAYALFRRALEN